uniref:Uncharacterized protein n=1 Tax=Rhizophora mucronata TaxID=61149 RepID=A0A2P2PIT6_RHIMU
MCVFLMYLCMSCYVPKAANKKKSVLNNCLYMEIGVQRIIF